MFGLGVPELLVILVIVMIIFGAGKLPEIGGAIGKGIKSFKKSVKEPDEIDVTPKNDKDKEKPASVTVAYNVFIGIGSNIGDRYSNCRSSIDQIISDHRAEFSALSSFYRTSPVSPVPQEEFLNCVLKIRWHGSPLELLALLNHIEAAMGRVRDVPQGPRIIDLDILLIDDLMLETAELTVPHPRLHERKFTLVPILEIEPSAVHPRLGRPLKDFLDEIGPEQVIERCREGDSS